MASAVTSLIFMQFISEGSINDFYVHCLGVRKNLIYALIILRCSVWSEHIFFEVGVCVAQ